MKKIIHIIFVLVCLYLGYCLPDSLPNDGILQNSRNPSRGFGNLPTLKKEIFMSLVFSNIHIFILDKVMHVRKKTLDNLGKENSSLNLLQIHVTNNGTMSISGSNYLVVISNYYY